MEGLIVIKKSELAEMIKGIVSEVHEKYQAESKNDSTELEESFITKKEAAKIAGVCLTTISNWLRGKKVNKYKFGKAVRINKSELITYLKSKSSDNA